MASDPTHRLELRRSTVIFTALGVFIAGALGAWAVGKAADGAVAFATDDGPVGVDIESSSGLGVLVPERNVPQLPHPSWVHDVWDRKVYAIGGVDVGKATAFYVYGTSDTPVVVTAVSAVEVDCKSAGDGWVHVSAEAGGALPDLVFGLDLKRGKDSASGVPEADDTGELWAFPRSVSQAEVERFIAIVVPPPTDICTYRLKITYRNDGDQGERLIDDDGEPFKVAGRDIAEPTLTAD